MQGIPAAPGSRGPSRNAVTFAFIALAVGLAVILAAFWASGAFSSPSSASTSHAPRAPTGLTEVNATLSSASIAWTAPSGIVTSYTVLYLSPWVADCQGTYSVYAQNITGTTETFGGWDSGTQECVEVEAVNGTQVGPPSTPIPVASVTAPPTGLNVIATTNSSVTLNWIAPVTSPSSGVVTNYDVFYTQGHSPETCGIWSVPIAAGAGLSYTVANLLEDATYCFELVAVDAGGPSAYSTALTDAETLGPEGQAMNALDGTTVVSTQTFSVTAGQLMLATVTSYGLTYATPVLTTQNGQTFALVSSYQNMYDTALWTYVFDVVANVSTANEVVTLVDTVTSQYMLGIVSYSGYTAVTTVGTWVDSTGFVDTGYVTTVSGATLVACIGFVTQVAARSFSPGYVEATWAAATTNSRADQWYYIDGAAGGLNSGTVTRALEGVTSIVLLALA